MNVSGSHVAVAGADGTATVFVPAPPPWHERRYRRISVEATGAATPQFSLYRGSVTPSAFLEGTFTGSQATSTVQHEQYAGEQFIGRWLNASPGALCTLTFDSTQTRTT